MSSQDHQIGLTGRKARIEVLDQDLEENRSVMTWQVAVPTLRLEKVAAMV